ncbi:MAG: glycosyltransferase family 39 protein [Candidatus Taylorbacteria bacterium]
MTFQQIKLRTKSIIVSPDRALMLIILSVSLILMLIYIFRPTIIWWDSSIYIGMGKWLFSHGGVGYFEPSRPLLWPFVQGLIWKAGIDNQITSRILEVFFALGAIYVIYLIGERVKYGSGIIAAALLSVTPFFFSFTNVGLTDIPTIFFTLLAFYLLQKDLMVWSGFFAGLAFLFRFPHALFIISIFLFFATEFVIERNFTTTIKRALRFGIGSAILGIPFFISNYILYGDILFPLKAGVVLVGIDPILQSQYFYYVTNILSQNRLLIFAPLALIPLLRKSWRENLKERKHLIAIFLIALTYIVYFSHTPHKEIRYAIGFLPWIALLTGIGISSLNFGKKTLLVLVTAGCIWLEIGNINHIKGELPLEPERSDYYEFFKNKNGKKVITSSPMILSVSDVKLIGVFDAWDGILGSYTSQKENSDYIALDTCGLSCSDGNCASKDILLSKLKNEATVELERTVGNCKLSIYKVK